ncbi:uncharacterized protein LOC106075553 [Biomphalaria glabrata]|uniref:Uncharacterized protein LOC106075553 n=1 Tax=Biomphalaria glabrata TaxID=6526 RepID=A0A9U8EKU7_BIOGL|nr:uncharacterized protein LOC106075553 [Biomphalaria glabrata]
MSEEGKVITDVALKDSPSVDPLFFDVCLVFVGCVCTVLMCLFGIVANVVNIPLFRRQGYRDGVNVTLTALAVSDLGAVTFELAYATIMNPYISEVDLLVSKVVIGFIVGYIHEYFTRVSSVITAFAALERCLCVTRPLKVKAMITTRVAVAVNLSIFLIYSGYLFPQFYSMYFDWAFVPERNRTVYVVFFTSRTASMFPITLYFTDMLLPYCTFLVLVSCSTVLFVTLKSKAKWRRLISGSDDRLSHVSTKERKSGLLFMSVSVMCIVLLLPQYLLFTAIIFVRALALDGYLSDLRTVFSTFTNFLKITNCSFTIFIYFKMSSKYRKEFQKMFGKCIPTPSP